MAFEQAPGIFDFYDPRRAALVPELLAQYAPQEAAFRAASQPVAWPAAYRPGQRITPPPVVGPELTTPTYNELLDYYGGGNGPASNSSQATSSPSDTDVQSVMGAMGMMSPENVGLGLATGMMGPAGVVGTIGKGLNMMQVNGMLAPANISQNIMSMVNTPAMAQAISMMDPDGTISIAPPVDSILHNMIVAQQHANSGGGTVGPGSTAATGPQGQAVASGEVEAMGPVGMADTVEQGAGSDAGAAGDTVICTELWKRGYIDEKTYALDACFGRMQAPEVVAGYHRWAIPYVRLMRRNDALGAFFVFLAVLVAKPWAKAMAAEVRRERGPIVGRVIMALGRPVCGWLGRRSMRVVA